MSIILIVEDDIGLNEGIALALKSEQYQFLSAYCVEEARRMIESKKVDLILLDVNLPDGNGYDLLTEIRKTSQVPVIMLTANDLELDEVKGLALGADDYITKPFSLIVLRARVERMMARMSATISKLFRDKEYLFDFDTLYFEKDGQEIVLSKTEQKVLKILIDHKGQTIPRETILDRVWSDGAEYVDENALSVTINRLRKKLDAKNSESRIRTVYGIGYVWEAEK